MRLTGVDDNSNFHRHEKHVTHYSSPVIIFGTTPPPPTNDDDSGDRLHLTLFSCEIKSQNDS
jgi:hypothetical protein